MTIYYAGRPITNLSLGIIIDRECPNCGKKTMIKTPTKVYCYECNPKGDSKK